MVERTIDFLERMAAEHPVSLSFAVFVLVTLIVVPASLPFYLGDTYNFLENIMAEAHGMIFDLLVIGWFILWLNKRAERRLTLRGYEDEIENFLRWESPEAMHRIVGNVRRLNRAGKSAIHLEHAYLRGAHLAGADLCGARLRHAVLAGANLEAAVLRDADLVEANLELAKLVATDARGARLMHANLQGAFLDGADLREAYLKCANLQGAFLRHADLRGAHLGEVVVRGAVLEGVDLRGAFLGDVDLADAKTLYGSHLDADLEARLRAEHPALFEHSDEAARPPQPTGTMG